jgi:hypothetical protein
MAKAISLAKALKVKNRLAGRLSDTQANIEAYNSVLEGRKGEVSVSDLYNLRNQLVESLITLKTAISDANTKQRRNLYEIEEVRGSITFLKGLNTRHGSEPAYGLQGKDQVYVATLQKKEVDQSIKKLESHLDELQDQIDTFNVTTRIEVEEKILDLAS